MEKLTFKNLEQQEIDCISKNLDRLAIVKEYDTILPYDHFKKENRKIISLEDMECSRRYRNLKFINKEDKKDDKVWRRLERARRRAERKQFCVAIDTKKIENVDEKPKPLF